MSRRWRARVYEVLADDSRGSWRTSGVHGFLIAMVLASSAAVVLETVPELSATHQRWFLTLEIVAIVVFALEYAARVWIAPEQPSASPGTAWRARRAYVFSPFGIVDLLAFLPYFVGLVVPLDPRWLRVPYLMRLFKLGRYAPALSLFTQVLRNEGHALFSGLMLLAVLMVIEASIMYVLEHDAQPQVFTSIPAAMWWATVTMASVGYGDIAPVTPWGKVFGGLVMVIGIATFAVPAGILATGFATELRRRDFLVSWHTVARLPLFAGLDAARIAEIAQLLQRQVVPARYTVVRRGEPADAMFFILEGQVEVDVPPTPRRLGPGQYFGEIALLHDTVRSATVVAVTDCQLLSLGAVEFRRLLDTHEDLRAAVREVADERLTRAPGVETTWSPG